MYSKCGELCYSVQAFENIEEPNFDSWNSLICAYVQNDRYEQALILFQEMRLSGRDPDEFTLVGVFDACTTFDWFKFGKVIHGSLIRRGMELNAFVGSSVVGMYSKSGVLSNAKRTFEDINLKGFVDAMALQLGRQVHGLIIKSRLAVDIVEANALITMYANFACAREAEQVFYRLEIDKTIVTWTAMIMCYAHYGCSNEALELFNQMESLNLKPDGTALISLLIVSCGDFHRLERSVERIMALEPNDLAAYLLLSNTYATHGQWKDVLKARKLMKQNGFKKEIGKS
ncbi:hypothetical protein Scep_022142 [Stephania cephalantha]|uniref:Pentatricopeptide repeat-containing protein n=1 Tax=Stephania cephalantha TaxID=152367 RepID=A0AAP0HXG7_9MAGN